MSEYYNHQDFSSSGFTETDLTATYSNDLTDQYPVTFPPNVPHSSHPSVQYGSNFQSSRPSFDEFLNTPNQPFGYTETYTNYLPEQYPVTFPSVVTNSSYPSEEYESNFQASRHSFDDYWNTPNQYYESTQNDQQVSTSCSPNSPFLVSSPTPSMPAPVASEASIPNLEAYPPKGSMISFWKKLTIPGKDMFIRIFNSLELDDDKKREYLERMEIQEEVKAHKDSSEDIAKQMDDQKTFIPNLDARPPVGTYLNTADLLSRNEESRQNLTYKGMCLTQEMFSILVLRRARGCYGSLTRNTKPWKLLNYPGQRLYTRIFNWLELDDDQKREYLEIMEIKTKLENQMDSSEEIPEQEEIRTKFIRSEIEKPNDRFKINSHSTSEVKTRIETDSTRNNQQISTPCTPNSSFLESSLTPTNATPVFSKASIPNLDIWPKGRTMNTTNIISRNEENRRNLIYRGKCLTQQMFSSLVLGKTQGHYCTLLKYTKPWKSLTKQGKKLFIRIFNWLNLEDDKKREYLEIMEIKEELKKVVDEEMAKQNKIRTASIPNLDIGRNYYEQEAADRV
ncbi:unnamed protein product [Caenorhabditis nigoni]